jgi:hypothetical protein
LNFSRTSVTYEKGLRSDGQLTIKFINIVII